MNKKRKKKICYCGCIPRKEKRVLLLAARFKSREPGPGRETFYSEKASDLAGARLSRTELNFCDLLYTYPANSGARMKGNGVGLSVNVPPLKDHM